MEAVLNGTFDSLGKLRSGKLTAGKADIWRQRIEDQRASGLSVRAWCQANGIRGQSFYWWRRRLGLAENRPGSRRSSPQPGVAPLSFAQVRLAASSGTVNPCVCC